MSRHSDALHAGDPGDYYDDPTDTAVWEHAVDLLTREPLAWVCPCGMAGHVDGGPHAGAAETHPFALEAEARIVIDNNAPAWEFACPGCTRVLIVDEEGTR